MTTTRSQIRRMDDVNLFHCFKVASKCLTDSEAEGKKNLVTYWRAKVDELSAELSRREALEAA